MVIRSKMKWVTLSLLILSLLSLLAQLSVTRFSTADLVQHSSMAGLRADFVNVSGSQVCFYDLLYGSILLVAFNYDCFGCNVTVQSE